MKISTQLIKARASSTNCTMGNLTTQHTCIQSMLNLPRFLSFLLYKSLVIDIYGKSILLLPIKSRYEGSLLLTLYKLLLLDIHYFDSDMSNNTNTVVYFDWKTAIYIYVCGKCHTQFMLPMEKSVTFTGACANEIIPSINRSFVYILAKEGCHVRIIDIHI